MTLLTNNQEFGPASCCTSLDQIRNLIRANPGKIKVRLQAATFGMALVASKAISETQFYPDVVNLLDQVAQAKAAIDIASCHDSEIAEATGFILLSAQRYVEETTFPCAEWPLPSEVAEVVFKAAKKCLSAFAEPQAFI